MELTNCAITIGVEFVRLLSKRIIRDPPRRAVSDVKIGVLRVDPVSEFGGEPTLEGTT